MIRKLAATCCLGLFVLSLSACPAPSDVTTTGPANRTVPGGEETPDVNKHNSGAKADVK